MDSFNIFHIKYIYKRTHYMYERYKYISISKYMYKDIYVYTYMILVHVRGEQLFVIACLIEV